MSTSSEMPDPTSGGAPPPVPPAEVDGSIPPPPPPVYGAPAGFGMPVAAPPPNYLAWAIVTTLLCFWPLGIVAIVFAAQVNTKWAAGDVLGAQNASRQARTFTIVAAVIGALIVPIVVFFWIIAVAAGSSGAGSGSSGFGL